MTDTIRPVMFRWKKLEICVEGGEVRRAHVMVPHQRFRPLCERQFEDDEDYALGPVEQPSSKSHRHFFVALKATWENLPDDLARRFPTPEHLRKKALIEAGHATEADYVLDTPRDAGVFARALRSRDAYAVIVVSKNTVKVFVAKSISPRVIKKDDFQKVKDRVFDYLATLTGLDATALGQEARRRAS